MLAAAVAIGLVPWSVLLGATLPRTFRAQNWSLAWVGLDAAIAVAAGATAVLLKRGDIRAALTSTATATLLLVDAWFDTCTSAPGLNHGVAVLEAAFVELPLSAGALWLAFAVLNGPRAARARATAPRHRARRQGHVTASGWARPQRGTAAGLPRSGGGSHAAEASYPLQTVRSQ